MTILFRNYTDIVPVCYSNLKLIKSLDTYTKLNNKTSNKFIEDKTLLLNFPD
jgi:hypothetical protein